ncbi:MAG: hypothetical protein ABI851_12240 [Saprospiraceae bacterium]
MIRQSLHTSQIFVHLFLHIVNIFIYKLYISVIIKDIEKERLSKKISAEALAKELKEEGRITIG